MTDMVERARGTQPTVPAAPLVAIVEALGGATAVGWSKDTSEARAYYRAKSVGRITCLNADVLAHRLDRHPVEIWGAEWSDAR